jgi:hypothetical protein
MRDVTHHQLVAAREPEERERPLDEAETHGWTSEELHGLHMEPRALEQDDPDDASRLVAMREAARLVLYTAERGEDGYTRVPCPPTGSARERSGSARNYPKPGSPSSSTRATDERHRHAPGRRC